MEQQIAQLWHTFQQPLHRYVTKQVQNPTDADDIVQEVFIKLMRHPDKLGHSGIKTYLYTTARNTIMDHFRSRSRQATDSTPDLPYPEGADVTTELIELAECCIHLLIDNLPDIYRDALTEVDLKGVSQKEYAERLGISYTGAKSRVQRGRDLLRESILGCCKYHFDRNGNIIGIQKESFDRCAARPEAASFSDEPRFRSDNIFV
jgi:RNA polymerase sigma-70 factor (ECF subfamily)